MYCNSCQKEFEEVGEICPKCGVNVKSTVRFQPQVVKRSNFSGKQIALGCALAAIFIFMAFGIAISGLIDSLDPW